MNIATHWFHALGRHKKKFFCGVVCVIIGIGILFSHMNWGIRGKYYPNPNWEGEPHHVQRDQIIFLENRRGIDALPAEAFSVKWQGWLAIPESGVYAFATESDDGSFLSVDRKLIVDNGGEHGRRPGRNTIALEKGVYRFEVLYFNAGGASFLDILWTPPGQVEASIPAEMFFVKRPTMAGMLWRHLLTPWLPWWHTHARLFVIAGLLGGILASVAKRLRTRGLFTHFWQAIRAYYVNNRLALGSFVAFLLALLVVMYLGQYPAIAPTDWEAHANYQSEDAYLAIDRNLATRWSSGEPMTPGMMFELDLRHPMTIGCIELFHGDSRHDYARGYRLEFSNDRLHWQIVPFQDSRASERTTVIDLEPFEGQYVRIRQTAVGHNVWSIHEISLYRPSFITRQARSIAILFIVCALVGGGGYLGMAALVRPQACRPLILVAVAVMLAFGFFLRVYLVQYHELHIDEKTYLINARLSMPADGEWLKLAFTTDITRSPLLHLLFARWIFAILGNMAFAIRLMSVILGTATILLVFLIRARLPGHLTKDACAEAFSAATMFAVCVLHVCWSRGGHGQITMNFFYYIYLAIAAQAFAEGPRHIRSFLGTGLFLFIGFCFHGSMFIAPFGLFGFMVLDLILSKARFRDWKSFQVKQYLALVISSMLFVGYVYYLLFMKDAFSDANTMAKMPGTFNTTSIIAFLIERWHLFWDNIAEIWEKSLAYGISPVFGIPFAALIGIGAVDIFRKRQKAEWFIILQPIFWGLSISALLVKISNFERHLLPLLLPAAFCAARGIVVLSNLFQSPRQRALSWSIFNLVVCGYLSVVTVMGLFLEEPQTEKRKSWLYRSYSGRSSTIFHLMQYIKTSQRGANSIMSPSPWIAPFYANMFQLKIEHVDSWVFAEAAYSQRPLPVFVLVSDTLHGERRLIDTVETYYDFVGTTLAGTTRDSLYELRTESQAENSASFPAQSSVLKPIAAPIRFRSVPGELTASEMIATLRQHHLHHPDDLFRYGLSSSLRGSWHHKYELREQEGEHVVTDHATDLMWQQSGEAKLITWDDAQRYVQTLNQQQHGGYSDWRLPVVEELASLLEPAEINDGTHLDPLFDPKVKWCWSADKVANSLGTSAWIVHFSHGNVSYRYVRSLLQVRAVRSLSP